MRLVIAYMLAALSAGLAAFYGWVSVDGWQAGLLKASILGAVAFIGCHGPAFVSEAWEDRRWGRAAFNCLVAAVCFAVTLAGGMGTIAGTGAQMQAQRGKAVYDTARDRGLLAAKQAERQAIPTARPLAAIEADLNAARANRMYRITDGCEPDQVVSRAAHEACGAFRRLESEAGAAAAASKLDAEITDLVGRLQSAHATPTADPQAVAISRVLGITVDAAAAWYAFLASLAMEVAAMAALLNADRPARVVEVPRNAAPAAPPSVFGRLDAFWDSCIQPDSGGRVAISESRMAYQAWCGREGLRPMSAKQFADKLSALCDERGVGISERGRAVYCVGVRLVG